MALQCSSRKCTCFRFSLTYGKQDSHCNPHAWVPRVKTSFYLWMVTNRNFCCSRNNNAGIFQPSLSFSENGGFFLSSQMQLTHVTKYKLSLTHVTKYKLSLTHVTKYKLSQIIGDEGESHKAMGNPTLGCIGILCSTTDIDTVYYHNSNGLRLCVPQLKCIN